MTLKLLAFLSTVLCFSGCGGGGGKSPVKPNNNVSSSISSAAKVLQFGFADAPLQPRAFNLESTDPSQDNWFYPGDTISLVWDADLFYSDGSTLGAVEKYIYDSKVYLSTDSVIQEKNDLKLFEIACSIPGSANYSCSDNASFQCVYAKNNLNVISCTSIPLDKINGFKEREIDSSAFITQIPLKANLIVENCLVEMPDVCLTKILPIHLN